MFNNTKKHYTLKRNDEIFEENAEWQIISELINKINLPEDFHSMEKLMNEGVVLFGAGIYGEFVKNYLIKIGVKVLCFCDNDKSKHGQVIGATNVISFSELLKLNSKNVIITARHFIKSISLQLDKYDIKYISFDSYFVKTMLDKYKYVYSNLLNDKNSKRIFIQILRSLLTGDNKYCSLIMEDNAFWAIPQFVNTGKEIFIDAGAYVGDTLEQFVWKNIGDFTKIYAFEPGERQFNAMLYRVKRLMIEWDIEPQKIVCVKAGLGENNSMLTYTYNKNSPLSSNFSTSNYSESKEIPIYSLDSFIGNEKVTFIKSDIEGLELEMLKGAQELIKKNHPKLAISIYHKPDDIFEIPIFIKSLVPEYKMAIRHHAPTLVDTILYCWIEE